MALYFKSGGGNAAATRVRQRWGGGWLDMQMIRKRVSGAWEVAWTLVHSVSVSAISASVPNGTQSRVSNCTVSGGIGPFSYSWSWASGGIGMTISNPNSASTNVVSTGTNTERIGTIRCTVTDNGTGQVVAATNSVNFQHGTPI